MPEYIEREALIKDFELMASVQPEYKQSTILGMVSTIKNRKAADVAPVVHSEWINYSGGNATCRRCGVRQRAVYDDDNDQNFCGHCGAKMDGGTP